MCSSSVNHHPIRTRTHLCPILAIIAPFDIVCLQFLFICLFIPSCARIVAAQITMTCSMCSLSLSYTHLVLPPFLHSPPIMLHIWVIRVRYDDYECARVWVASRPMLVGFLYILGGVCVRLSPRIFSNSCDYAFSTCIM